MVFARLVYHRVVPNVPEVRRLAIRRDVGDGLRAPGEGCDALSAAAISPEPRGEGPPASSSRLALVATHAVGGRVMRRFRLRRETLREDAGNERVGATVRRAYEDAVRWVAER